MATSPITKPLENIETKYIRIIGVPLDLGQSRRGVDMGPSAMRVAGLEAKLEALGYDVEDGGNVPVAMLETEAEGDPHAKYLTEITETCSAQAELVIKTLEAGKIPLTLGGDHSIAAGTVSGVAEFYRRKHQRIGLLWIDAHSDINTPDTSPSGNVHGMPLGAIMGLFQSPLSDLYGFSPKVRAENCVLVGIRDVDEHERLNIRQAGVHVFTMRDIDERGMRSVMEEALAPRRTRHGRLSCLARSGLDRSGRRARRGHAGVGRRDLSRGAPGDGDHRRPRPHAQLRAGRSQPGARRTQSDRGTGGRAGAVGIRQEDPVSAVL